MKPLKAISVLLFCIIAISCKEEAKYPKEAEPGQVPQPIKSVNVFIENSKSMDGFMSGGSEFKSNVFEFLSDIRVNDVADSMNLYYINSSVIPWQSGQTTLELISDFVEKLNPTTFERRGGVRKNTDLSRLIKQVIDHTDTDAVTFFITDGSFSPGKKDSLGNVINPDDYLINQRVGIKVAVSDYLKRCPTACVAVFQLLSNFSGTYYDKLNTHIAIKNMKRPYYIWVIGNADQVSRLLREAGDAIQTKTVTSKTFIASSRWPNVRYHVVPRSGVFQIVKHKGEIPVIEKLKKAPNGSVCFSIDADLSKLPYPDQYLCQAGNWTSTLYDIDTIVRNASDNAFTHRISLTSDKPRNGEMVLELMMSEPSDWAEVNDTVGGYPIDGATYGILAQVKGVYEAFHKSGEVVAQMKVVIK